MPPGQVFSPVQQVIESDAVKVLLSQLSGSCTFTAIFTSTEEASASTLLFNLRFLLFLFPSSPEQRRQIKHFLADKTPPEEQSAVKKRQILILCRQTVNGVNGAAAVAPEPCCCVPLLHTLVFLVLKSLK